MIKEINKQGTPCLYTPTEPVVPIITKGEVKEKDKSIISLTDNQDKDYHYPGVEAEKKETHDNKKKETFTCVWPQMYLDLVRDLLDTAESIADTCMGLAATQIWDKKEPCPAIFVMRWPSKEHKRGWNWQEFINPAIKGSGKTLKLEEGCLSYPGLKVRKTRKANVTLAFQTLTDPRRQVHKFTANEHGWIPHVMQHECDHLMGKCVRSKNFKK